MTRLPIIVAICLTCVVTGGCGKRPTWKIMPGASPSAIQAALDSNPYYPYFWDTHRDQIPDIAPPVHLRPCCVFGMDVRSRVGPLPVPMYRVANITSPELLGPHVYDSGFLGRGSDQEIKSMERNGLIYTCRAGYVDTAHVRDYADWTVYLSSWVMRHLGDRAQQQFLPELGPRTVKLKKVDVSGLDPAQQKILAVSIGQYLAYQISVWHEIAQWHGYSVIKLFPELASAHSIEDLYSNVLGTKVAAAIIYSGAAGTDLKYARTMDVWLEKTIESLAPLSRQEGRLITQALDQHWWDSHARVPDKWLVLARNYHTGRRQQPPRVERGQSEATDHLLEEFCSEDFEPLVMAVDDEVLGYRIPDIATLEIRIDEQSAPHFSFPTPRHAASRIITERDFQAIVNLNRGRDQLELQELGWRPNAQGPGASKLEPPPEP